eukprot:scaffold50667_cov48-Attheya_sp.AAC.4
MINTFRQRSRSKPGKSNVSIAQCCFSTLPYESKHIFHDPDFLTRENENRAQRAHENDPSLAMKLEAFSAVARNIRSDGAEGGCRLEAAFCNSILDMESFIDVVDAALIHLKKDRFYRSNDGNTYRKRIIIMGGGPSGLLAAIESILHGHDVTLIEARPAAVRTRCVGLHPVDVIELARLGAPVELFQDTFAYIEKGGVALYEIERFLTAIALKLGVKIYRNAAGIAPTESSQLERGEVIIRYREPSRKTAIPTTGEIDRNTIVLCEQASRKLIIDDELMLRFDILIDSTGGRRTFVPALLGSKESVVPLHICAADQLEFDSSRSTYEDPKEEHITQVMKSTNWEDFCKEMVYGKIDPSIIPQNQEVTAFLANMPRSVFKSDQPVPNLFPACPPDWIFIPLPPMKHLDNDEKEQKITSKRWSSWKNENIEKHEKQVKEGEKRQHDPRVERTRSMANSVANQSMKNLERGNMYINKSIHSSIFSNEVSNLEEGTQSLGDAFMLKGGDEDVDRVLFEGMLPKFMKTDNGENGFESKELANSVDNESLLNAFTKCCTDLDCLDPAAVNDYIKTEGSWENHAQNSIASFTFHPAGIRLNIEPGAPMMIHGKVPGKSQDRPEYFIIGDACQDAWFRWGIGIHDAFHSVRIFSNCLAIQKSYEIEEEKQALVENCIRSLEKRLRLRSVQTSAYYWHFGTVLKDDPRMAKAAEYIAIAKDHPNGESRSISKSPRSPSSIYKLKAGIESGSMKAFNSGMSMLDSLANMGIIEETEETDNDDDLEPETDKEQAIDQTQVPAVNKEIHHLHKRLMHVKPRTKQSYFTTLKEKVGSLTRLRTKAFTKKGSSK